MDKKNLTIFIKGFFGKNCKITVNDKWMNISCPFAPFLHEKGTDANPSFGLYINDNGPTICNCFTCGPKGDLHDTVLKFGELSGKDYLKEAKGIKQDEIFAPINFEFIENKKESLGKPLPEEYENIYDSALGHKYLKNRGITDNTARKIGIKVDYDDYGQERVLFPVFSTDNGFHGYTGRAVKDSVYPKVRDYLGLRKRLLLLGSHLIGSGPSTVVLVEGLFDYANLIQCGYSAVACLHSRLTIDQAKVLIEIDRPVYFMLDNDLAGRQGTIKSSDMIKKHVPCFKTKYPEGVKDPAELNKTQVKKMISGCRLL